MSATCHGCQARPALPGSHYCGPCEHACLSDALPIAILPTDDPGHVAGQLDLAHALNEGDDAMTTIPEARQAELRATGDQRSGTDRRAPVPSPVGDRWRAVAESLEALSSTAADHAGDDGPYTAGYATGQQDAYAAAARIVRALADTEDIR